MLLEPEVITVEFAVVVFETEYSDSFTLTPIPSTLSLLYHIYRGCNPRLFTCFLQLMRPRLEEIKQDMQDKV